jgi:beta-ureidopropionase / N-carbamoyl-L-amino-acid hydrolase
MTALQPKTAGGFAGGARIRDLAEGLFDALRRETGDGVGITREAYSERESAALAIVEAKAAELGLKSERDAGANLVVTLPGKEPKLPFLACGSHLDSVPQGGNFDGAAGVVAGLAVLAAFIEEGFAPKRNIRLYGLRGEESARFGKAYLGSSALLGQLTAADLTAKDLTSGQTLADCMQDVGVDIGRVKRGKPLISPKSIAAWIELHIEQGPVLVARDMPIGIVTGIRGSFRHRMVECIGEPGHSGAVPRSLRHDAVFAAAELIGRLDRHWEKLLKRGHDAVITCGVLGTDPQEHAIARIPGRVRFSFEVRSQSSETLEAFYELFLSECRSIEKRRGVEFRLDRRVDGAPALMDAAWVSRLKRAAHGLGLAEEEIPSGAGHDAAVFANKGIPSAMIFVRNRHGSHNPKESMDLDDFVKGVAVMKDAMKDALS